jgi:hypothetical protein
MNRSGIRIDKLDIRMRGVSSQAARASIDGLGKGLLEEITKQHDGNNMNSKYHVKINSVDLGNIKTGKDTSPSEIRSMIVDNISSYLHKTYSGIGIEVCHTC